MTDPVFPQLRIDFMERIMLRRLSDSWPSFKKKTVARARIKVPAKTNPATVRDAIDYFYHEMQQMTLDAEVDAVFERIQRK